MILLEKHCIFCSLAREKNVNDDDDVVDVVVEKEKRLEKKGGQSHGVERDI